jgi:hypothetical protein
MKETIQEPGKDQKAPVQKKEKKDKGKEKAVEEDEEQVEEDDDSAWLANKRKEALAEDAPAESTKSNVRIFHNLSLHALIISYRTKNNSSSPPAACLSVI